MNLLVVLFHYPEHDVDNKLNEFLDRKGVELSWENKACAINFPDGSLVACFDIEPDDQIKLVIGSQIIDGDSQRRALLIHKRHEGFDVQKAQECLAGSGGILSDACPIHYYSHTIEHAIYRALVGLESELAPLISALEAEEKKTSDKTLDGRFCMLKHRFTRLFLPIDMDIQCLAENGFKQDIWDDIVKSYNDKNGAQRLEEAIRLIHQPDLEYSAASIAEDFVKGASKDAGANVEAALGRVKRLLPDSPGDESIKRISLMLDCFRAAGRKETLRANLKDNKNPFRLWFERMDKALDDLRDSLIEQGEEPGAA
jgi:hypothetical protein